MPHPERATVLVVDDERGPRDALRLILDPVHRVITARDGAEALALLAADDVDVVTLDLQMPRLPGDALMRTVRSRHRDVEVIVVTGRPDWRSAAAGVRAGISDYLSKPFDVVQVRAAVDRALTRRAEQRRIRAFLDAAGAAGSQDPTAAPILRSLYCEIARAGDLERTGPLPFLEMLADTIESQDATMRGHARRVASYAARLADRLELDAAEREHVRMAAFLHDVGKIGVPSELLLRPGVLTAEERSVIERHAAIGARLLEPLELDALVVRAVRHHHERWDGAGYPDGLAGEEIPLAARVVQTADAFDAMTCNRVYRRAMPQAAARAELVRSAGSQFDVALVEQFLAVLDEERVPRSGER